MRHDFDKVDSLYYKTDKGPTDRQLLCSYNFNNILAAVYLSIVQIVPSIK